MRIIRSVNFQRRTYYNPDHPIVIRKIITAGLGGVVQQMINNGQWGIVSTYNEGNELKDYLRQKGIGFIMMQGAWVDEEIQKFVDESSLLLPCVSERLVQAIASKYEQGFYFFAQNNKYKVKATTDGEIINEGNIRKHFKQFYNMNDKYQFDTSKTKERHWMLDRHIPARSNSLANEIYDQQHEHLLEKVKLKLRIPKSQTAFIAWVKRPKYVVYEGVVRDAPNTPPVRRLAAYLPLG